MIGDLEIERERVLSGTKWNNRVVHGIEEEAEDVINISKIVNCLRLQSSAKSQMIQFNWFR